MGNAGPTNAEQLLAQLRDVHSPLPVSWWPPAPGWWIVAALVLIIIGLIIYRWLKSRRNRRYRVTAINNLQQSIQNWQSTQDDGSYLNEASQVLRQVAIHVNGREAVASLTQENWVSLLDAMLPSGLSALGRAALTTELYKPEPKADIPRLHAELLAWLRRHRSPSVESNASSAQPG